MIELFGPIAQACDLSIDPAIRRGVGIVGAGAIVRLAHLPAYQAAGLRVCGITDLDPGRAAAVAGSFGVPVAADLETLLADPAVDVVDIAVHPRAQPQVCRQALAAGKHVLAQKPLAEDSTTAGALVREAVGSGRSLVVNHQMRYGEGMAAARAMVQQGWIGEVTAMTFDVDIATDWSAWPWLVSSPRLELMYHSIHYFDSIRAVLGDPETLFCAIGRRPGQVAAGETRSMTTMTFTGGALASVCVNHENTTGDQHARFRIDGTEGSVRGTIGLLYDYPHGRPDTVHVNSHVLPTDGWVPYPVTRRWIPDAFVGPMGALLGEIAGRTTAPTTAADALKTLQVVEAAYLSAESRSAVTLGAP